MIFKTQVHYFGFLVGTGGVQPLPEKVAAIEALEPPKDIKELRHFLGLVGFYRKFIRLFANVTVCLNKMLWKGSVFVWTEQWQCIQAAQVRTSKNAQTTISKSQ